MRLTNCPVCSHAVSSDAMACPNCGHRIQKYHPIQITFPKCPRYAEWYVYEKNGYLLKTCKRGELVEFQSDRCIDVVIKTNLAYCTCEIQLEPEGMYQVILHNTFWRPFGCKMSIIKSLLNLR